MFDDDVDESGAPFLVMELLEGRTVAEYARVQGGSLPPLEVLDTVVDRVLAFEPGERFENAAAMREAIGRWDDLDTSADWVPERLESLAFPTGQTSGTLDDGVTEDRVAAGLPAPSKWRGSVPGVLLVLVVVGGGVASAALRGRHPDDRDPELANPPGVASAPSAVVAPASSVVALPVEETQPASSTGARPAEAPSIAADATRAADVAPKVAARAPPATPPRHSKAPGTPAPASSASSRTLEAEAPLRSALDRRH